MIEQQPVLLKRQGQTRRSTGSSQGGSQQREATTVSWRRAVHTLCRPVTTLGLCRRYYPVRDASSGYSGTSAEGIRSSSKSRPAAMEFAPVGIAQPKRGVAAKPKSGVAAAEAEMDAIRAKNEAKAKDERGRSARPSGRVERHGRPERWSGLTARSWR